MKNIKLGYLTTAIILASIIFTPVYTSAHNGGKDELGGHFRSSDCTYQLHEPTALAKSARNISELIQLIKQFNNNKNCAAKLNESKVELEGYTFSAAGSTMGASEQKVAPAPKAKTVNGKLKLGSTYDATLIECTDGDTAVFNIDGKDYKTRFLYIDTPESTRSKEPFGDEAAAYTCSFLKKGEITLETDGGNLFDKYDRLLAWVWVGDKLHQEEITKAGFVEDFYDYGKYKYETIIWQAMDYATDHNTGMYRAEKKDSSTEVNKDHAGEGKGISGLIIFIGALGVISLILAFKKIM